MDNNDKKKLDLEELKEVAGGTSYDYDWLITCSSCKNQFVIHGFIQMVYCPFCDCPIYMVHGEGNPKKINPDES